MTVSAQASAHYCFSHWDTGFGGLGAVGTAGCTETVTRTVTATETTKVYTAIFTKKWYELTVNAGGGGTASGGGRYAALSTATVTATGQCVNGTIYVFSKWTGPVASTSSSTTTVYMNADKTVTALFSPFLAC